MKLKIQYIISGTFWMASLTVAAQVPVVADTTMNRTVVVEQNYTPEIAEVTKINVLPEIEQPSVEKPEVSYAGKSVPVRNIPAGKMEVMDVPLAGQRIYSGFLRAGYGNNGNLDVAGSYLGYLSERDRINAGLTVRGMNGDILFYSPEQLYWSARSCQTQANLGYRHRFDRLELDLAGRFGWRQFNTMPDMILNDGQRFLSGDLHVGVESQDADYALQFKAETNWMVYNRKLVSLYENPGGVTEHRIRTRGSVDGQINEEQSVTVALEMNNLFYSQPYRNWLVPFQDRTLLDLNPSYEYGTEDVFLRLGANVDFSFGSGKTLRVSPDVEGRYVFSDRYVVFLKATGGRRLADFRKMEDLNPYAVQNLGVLDSYEVVNAQLGLKASPMDGWWFQLNCGYQYLADDWYCDYPDVDIVGKADAQSAVIPARDYGIGNWDASNFYAQARLDYAFKEYVDFSAAFEYRNWDTKATWNKNVVLSQKPRYRADLQLGLRPFRPLRLELGYNYIRRMEKFVTVYGQQQQDVNQLYVHADYAVRDWLSVYTRCNNILNDRYCLYPFVPEQGFHFVAGLRCRF